MTWYSMSLTDREVRSGAQETDSRAHLAGSTVSIQYAGNVPDPDAFMVSRVHQDGEGLSILAGQGEPAVLRLKDGDIPETLDLMGQGTHQITPADRDAVGAMAVHDAVRAFVAGNVACRIAVHDQGILHATGNIQQITATDMAVVSSDHAPVRASGDASAILTGDAVGVLQGNASAEAFDDATVHAHGFSKVDLYDGSHGDIHDHAMATVYDRATATGDDEAIISAGENISTAAAGVVDARYWPQDRVEAVHTGGDPKNVTLTEHAFDPEGLMAATDSTHLIAAYDIIDESKDLLHATLDAPQTEDGTEDQEDQEDTERIREAIRLAKADAKDGPGMPKPSIGRTIAMKAARLEEPRHPGLQR